MTLPVLTTCTIGAYTIDTAPTFFGDGIVRDYWKDGQLIGHTIGGTTRLLPRNHHKCYLTRAKGFRYWKKHFPERPWYLLPSELADAVEKPPRSFGQYASKKDGALIGYEG